MKTLYWDKRRAVSDLLKMLAAAILVSVITQVGAGILWLFVLHFAVAAIKPVKPLMMLDYKSGTVLFPDGRSVAMDEIAWIHVQYGSIEINAGARDRFWFFSWWHHPPFNEIARFCRIRQIEATRSDRIGKFGVRPLREE